MAVKFEFTVSGADAENILAFIRDAALRSELRAQDAIAAKDAALEQRYRRDAQYILGLADVMAKGTSQVTDIPLNQV